MGKRVSAVTVLALVALLMPILANGQRSRNFDERYNERYEVNEKGDSSFTLVPQAFVEPASVTSENSERIALSARQILRMQKVNGLKKAAFQRSAADAIDISLPVAGIPIVSGISPTGARTYSIPIATAPGYGLTPQISLQYNSQGSNGIAGYGWSIGGLSSVTVSGKSPYYDGSWAAPDPSSSDAIWSLDGVRLVKNTDSYTSTYQFETVSGNIKVMKHLASNGVVSYFTAIYPDGRKVKYGWETNSSAKRCYPVTEIEDAIGNLITFNYESLSYTGNVYVISKIDYGHRRVSGTVTTPKESIYFFYENRTDCIEMYYAGELVCCKKLLTRVSSPGILHEYNLSHNLSDGVNLLSSVECKVADQAINPLRFHYGGEGTGQTVVHIEDGSFRQTGDGYLMSYFNDSITTVKNRGKLVPNSYDDGLIIHPYFSPYKVVYWDKKWYETKRSYKYGSGYPEDQVILVAPRVEDGVFDVDRTLTTGAGFQTIEALDVNGDGIEELVKINFGDVKDDKTTLTLTVYQYTNGRTPSVLSSKTVSLEGTITVKRYTSPLERVYQFGDYNGDGKMELLTMTLDRDIKGNSRSSRFAVVDIMGGTVLSDLTLFDFSHEDYAKNSVLSIDLDNDGLTELCRLTASGVESYKFSSGRFSLSKTYSGFTSDDLSIYKSVYYTDLNGDGYPDFVIAPDRLAGSINHRPSRSGSTTVSTSIPRDNTWNEFKFTGSSFVRTAFSLPLYKDCDYFFLDADRDGLPELVERGIKERGRTSNMAIFRNINGDIRIDQRISANLMVSNIVPCNATNYRGVSSLISIDGYEVKSYGFSANTSSNRLLTSVVDSYGTVTEDRYVDMSIQEILSLSGAPYSEVYSIDRSRSYSLVNGFVRRIFPLNLLRESTTTDLSSTMLAHNSYIYYDAVVNSRGLGFCGFGKVSALDMLSQRSSEWITTMEKRDPENSGVVTEMNRYLGNVTSSTSPFETISYTWNKVYGTYRKYHPRLYSSLSVDNLTGKKITTTYSYDAFDYPIKIVTGVGDGSSSETVEITYSHKRNPSQYVLGLEASRKVTRKSANQSTWIDRTVTSYDESVLRPASVVTFTGVDGGRKTGETRWTYDGYGNVLSEKSAPYSSTAFVGDTYAYDNNGRFIKYKTDALGRTTSYTLYNSYGSPMIVVDPKGRSTYYSYDCFGNVTRKRYPDLSEETVATEWGGEGLYTVTKSVTQQPTTKIHYNAAGREVRSEVQRFDGTWLVTDTEYRADGLVDKVSLPFKGDSASGWAVYDYDAYKRPIKIEEASGKVSTWAYSGLSMTTTGEGLSSTKTSDQSGRVCSIQDPGGEITYSYRPDGQLEQVVAPESVLTSFEYDSYGRRIKIIDPSAGVRSTSYVNNNDGSSVVTETNPNGSVVTYLDAYGRKTKVERPGEYNTVYTYSDDNLLMSEVSTNGTSTVYAYDNLDRVSSVKTTVPDGKWLLKEYTYGDGSVVNTVKYSSQDGEIAIEVYSYSNGYNVQIALAAGTVIWRLVEENNFGQPTRALTGNVDRFYSFDAHGLPTGRALGAVQEFAYDFDPVTGNLEDRFDAVNSAGEIFGYDDLNRLDTVIPDACGDLSQYSVSYRPNGNISEKEGTGVFSYESNARPYQLTKIDLESGVDVPRVPQSISYTCYSRPSRIVENGVSCSFTYDGDGNRAKMLIANGATPILSRYYIGGQYELDAKADGTVQRLYLGGDAYSAPMVYVKDGSNPWLLYNIGRDYLGSVTCIASVDGALVAEYSYDPWGRLRNPETLELYANGEEPELFLGRGFTGHEHLPYFGLINMNARLYDPFTGRFLSPDPYVQAPDFTQNYNRYSYALNNPLKYTDISGEVIPFFIIGIAAAAVIAGSVNVATNWDNIDGFWEGFTTFTSGAIAGAGVMAVGIFTGGSGWMALAGAGAGAMTALNNGIISQTGKNFDGFRSIVWDPIWKNVLSGAAAGAVTSLYGQALAVYNPYIKLSEKMLRSPLLGATFTLPITSAAGHIVGGTVYGLLDGQKFKDAFSESFEGIGESIALSMSIGIFSTVATSMFTGINPITGKQIWPKNFGFNAGSVEDYVIQEGDFIDRYGDTNGRFMSPDGTPFDLRGLPKSYEGKTYTRYVVNKPIPVTKGIASPVNWFTSAGGGTQYYLSHSVQYYIDNGYISVVK